MEYDPSTPPSDPTGPPEPTKKPPPCLEGGMLPGKPLLSHSRRLSRVSARAGLLTWFNAPRPSRLSSVVCGSLPITVARPCRILTDFPIKAECHLERRVIRLPVIVSEIWRVDVGVAGKAAGHGVARPVCPCARARKTALPCDRAVSQVRSSLSQPPIANPLR